MESECSNSAVLETLAYGTVSTASRLLWSKKLCLWNCVGCGYVNGDCVTERGEGEGQGRGQRGEEPIQTFCYLCTGILKIKNASAGQRKKDELIISIRVNRYASARMKASKGSLKLFTLFNDLGLIHLFLLKHYLLLFM